MPSSETASLPSASLVFVTYSDAKTGREHDAKTKRLVRKRAFDASRSTGTAALHPRREKGVPLVRHSLKDGQGRFRIPKDSPASYEGTIHSQQIPASLSTFGPITHLLGPDAWDLARYCMLSPPTCLPLDNESLTRRSRPL